MSAADHFADQPASDTLEQWPEPVEHVEQSVQLVLDPLKLVLILTGHRHRV